MPMEIHEDKIIMRAGKYALPKRWTGLTLDERAECYEKSGGNLSKFAKAIEDKLKEKNDENK